MSRPAASALALVALALLAPPSPAWAQEKRFEISLGGGAALGTIIWTRTATWPEYEEAARLESDQEARTGPAIEAAVGFRLSRHLGLRAAFGWSRRDGRAALRAEIPHPFFYERPRSLVAETAGLDYRERAAHLDVEWWPVAGRLEVGVFGGMSLLGVEADLVDRVEHGEEYPFDDVSFRSAVTSASRGDTALGWSGGATVAYGLGAGWSFVLEGRYTRARAELSTSGGEAASVDAGGLKAVALCRLRF